MAGADEFLINDFTTSLQFVPSVTGLTAGGFVVTWVTFEPVSGDHDVGGIGWEF